MTCKSQTLTIERDAHNIEIKRYNLEVDKNFSVQRSNQKPYTQTRTTRWGEIYVEKMCLRKRLEMFLYLSKLQ